MRFNWGSSILQLTTRTSSLGIGDSELTDISYAQPVFLRLTGGPPPYTPLTLPIELTFRPDMRNIFAAAASGSGWTILDLSDESRGAVGRSFKRILVRNALVEHDSSSCTASFALESVGGAIASFTLESDTSSFVDVDQESIVSVSVGYGFGTAASPSGTRSATVPESTCEAAVYVVLLTGVNDGSRENSSADSTAPRLSVHSTGAGRCLYVAPVIPGTDRSPPPETSSSNTSEDVDYDVTGLGAGPVEGILNSTSTRSRGADASHWCATYMTLMCLLILVPAPIR